MKLLRVALAGATCISRHYSTKSNSLSTSRVCDGPFQRIRTASIHSSSSRLGVPEPIGEDASEQRTPPSEKVVRIVEEITSLTLLEVSDLTRLIQRKLGMPEGMGMGMGMGMPMGMPMGGAMPSQGAAAVEEAPKVEKTAFDIKMDKVEAAARLKVIKEIRAITGLGLKESKDLVEKLPGVIKKGVTKEEAATILEKLKAAGAECSME